MEFSSWVKGNLRRKAAQAFFLFGDSEETPHTKVELLQTEPQGWRGLGEQKGAWLGRLRVLSILDKTRSVTGFEVPACASANQTLPPILSKPVKTAKLMMKAERKDFYSMWPHCKKRQRDLVTHSSLCWGLEVRLSFK